MCRYLKDVSKIIDPLFNECLGSAVEVFDAKLLSDDVQKALADIGVKIIWRRTAASNLLCFRKIKKKKKR